jgi:hypothetical protein
MGSGMRVLECSRVNLAGAASRRSSQPVGSPRLLTFFLLGAALGAAILGGQSAGPAARSAALRPPAAAGRTLDAPAARGAFAVSQPPLSGLFHPAP